MVRFLKILSLFCVLILPVNVEAADEVVDKSILYASRQKFDISPYLNDLKQAENYLSSFKTMQAKFSEISSEQGNVSRGTVSVSRPGKLKVDYRSPDSMVIIVKGDDVMYYDRDNDTVSYGELKNNPLDILLYQNIKLVDNVRITDIKSDKSTFAVTLAPEIPEKSSESFSEFVAISLVFNKMPFALSRIRKIDVNNHATTFSFVRPKFDIEFPDNAFPFHNPRGDRKRRKN